MFSQHPENGVKRGVYLPLLFSVCVALLLPALTSGHGRLLEPPSRQSAWRAGFKTPINYDDHALYCGGRSNEWDVNGGKCGICGDPWQGPRKYERPNGELVKDNNVIPRTYRQGDVIDAQVQITVNHKVSAA
ncbi:uncharacterized protein LOC101846453 [Aplysia californica]|uniref:Uncharacterized protein LOC101846453 n=1 Tax=Aplysia californica TaxID=6500 RepID=A0ABM0K1A3_APLCA|nr:uncharacterized protein LOC101846453 [Aplysia californica]